MTEVVVVAAVRTPIGTSFKGSLTETTPAEMGQLVVSAALSRSGLAPMKVDDIVLAESNYGGGVVARFVAVESGLSHVPGQSVNRHCAGGLTAVQNAAGSIKSGMDRAVIAGGVHSSSLNPKQQHRVPGSTDEWIENWMSPAHPDVREAPNRDMTITVGWNTAQEAGITREDMDAWALRSHERAIAAIDAGHFDDEIVTVKALLKDGSYVDFAVDEHPRRGSTLEKLASLRVLHPEIDNFSITAGNSSGVNDGASALMLTSDELAAAEALKPLATVRAWANVAVEPRRNGMAAVEVLPKVLDRAGLTVADVDLWEINEAFASVPIAACRTLGIDEDIVNVSGSGCSLGHPIAASGARMLTSVIHELRRRGGGIGVAAMCAGGGQGGAVLVEVH